MRVQVVDPSAFTPPYDHALCAALARAGASVELVTSRFPYGEVPAPDGYTVSELFYGRLIGAPGSRVRRAAKLAAHVPDMLRFRRHAAGADVVHLQWLTLPVIDIHLLPRRPLVLTAHDLLPREPRPGQVSAQRRLLAHVDAVIVHSEYGRRQLVEEVGVDPVKVHVIHHGAFAHVAAAAPGPLPPELAASGDGLERGQGGHRLERGRSGDAGPVVLFAGLLRPYKGLDTLLRAWRGVDGAQLWIAGRPMMPLGPLRQLSSPSVRWVPRYVTEGELVALMERADVLVLPYARTERFDQSGVLASALALGKPAVVSAIGGFPELGALGAVRLVPPGDADALAAALNELVTDAAARERLGAAALAAARGPYSWEESARRTVELYERITQR